MINNSHRSIITEYTDLYKDFIYDYKLAPSIDKINLLILGICLDKAFKEEQINAKSYAQILLNSEKYDENSPFSCLPKDVIDSIFKIINLIPSHFDTFHAKIGKLKVDSLPLMMYHINVGKKLPNKNQQKPIPPKIIYQLDQKSTVDCFSCCTLF